LKERIMEPLAETIQPSNDKEIGEFACFVLDEERYAVDILKVREVARYQTVSRLPRFPSFVEGVINLRGNIIPVVDMRKRFGLAPADPTKRTRIIIMSVIGKIIGVIVDEAREVVRVPMSEVKQPPKFVKDIESDYLSGVIEREKGLIFILDFDMDFHIGGKDQAVR
jgi:purine-binding chemotaxis protein CheW